jgi:protein-S-isoprenylcysteine O-methyltransferase Ste14
MHTEGTAIVIMNFIAIGALPLLFFKRDGKFNLQWWLTALPFYVSSASILFVPSQFHDFADVRGILAMAASVTSLFLIAFTLGSHRVPIALWHQTNDAPQHIVTWGAYRYVRHPFYASFLLAFLAAALYSPQILTIISLLYGFTILNKTAEKEEEKLASSDFGAEYRDYLHRTGRFLPRVGGV